MGSTSPEIIGLTKRWRKVFWLWAQGFLYTISPSMAPCNYICFQVYFYTTLLYLPTWNGIQIHFTYEMFYLRSPSSCLLRRLPQNHTHPAVGWLLTLPVKSSNQAPGFYITQTSCNWSGRRAYGTNITNGKDKELGWSHHVIAGKPPRQDPNRSTLRHCVAKMRCLHKATGHWLPPLASSVLHHQHHGS